MPRIKQQKLKKRPDGRYACRYHSQWFYSYDHDDCLRQREAFKEAERRGRVAVYFVKGYAEGWLARSRPDIAPSTMQGLRTHLANLTDAIGSLPVSDVKPSDIKAVFSTRYKGLSNSYIKAAKQLYCAMFDSAVADGLIVSNPARDRTAKPHKGTAGGNRSITPQEQEWIVTLCTDHRAHPAAMAMLFAGLRPQEAKALVIDRDIDFDRETVTVRQTAHTDRENGQKYAFSAQGKTERANRTIPLLPPLKTAVFGRTGLLVASAHGQPVTKSTWRVLWRSYVASMEKAINGVDRRWYGRTKAHKALLAAGALPPWQPFTVKPYDLRHTFCTLCRSMQPPIELHTVIRWMGHADARMVLQVYDSVPDSREAGEAERIKAAFRCQNGSQSQTPQAVTVDK